MHLPVVDVAARFDDLKPTEILDRFRRMLDGLLNCILDGSGGCPGDFDDFVDVICHLRCLWVSQDMESRGAADRRNTERSAKIPLSLLFVPVWQITSEDAAHGTRNHELFIRANDANRGRTGVRGNHSRSFRIA